MSTIVTALLIILSTIGIPLIFILIKKKRNNRKNKTLLTLFSQQGTQSGLSFSSHELLRTKIIGVDGIKKAILVFNFENTGNVISIVMEEVKNCTVEKKYDSILIGAEGKTKVEPHLRSIDLAFTFKTNREAVSVSFYDSNVNSIYEMRDLETKAKKWEEFLSKMIQRERKVSA